MGEYKANSENHRRLLLRLEFPKEGLMVVEVSVAPDFLERVLKLVLICAKIRRTMHGRAKVLIEDARCQYFSILNEAPIERLLSMARVSGWNQLQSIWIPENFLLGKFGQCRVMGGMRMSQTIVDEDRFWIRGHDGSHEFVSVALGRDWLNREVAREANKGHAS